MKHLMEFRIRKYQTLNKYLRKTEHTHSLIWLQDVLLFTLRQVRKTIHSV
jgi:hypothetical protein